MAGVRLSFELERPTKNTVRYQEKPEEKQPDGDWHSLCSEVVAG